MNTMMDLQTALLDLLHEIRGTEIKLIIGGGYGIYLKDDYVRQLKLRTLFENKPEARSTNDLDLFLRPELLIQSAKLTPLAEALPRLGYKVIETAKNYQFVKHGPTDSMVGSIKIDILTGPEKAFDGSNVQVDDRRARPNPSVGIHAHPVNESPTLEEGLLSIPIDGTISSGESWRGEVFLPHPYTFLMMKLFAFRDRLQDSNKDFGRYHALDLYSVLATTTESEWKQAEDLRDRFKAEETVSEASHIVSEHFSTAENLGIIRLKESRYFRPELQLSGFISNLRQLFPT